MTLTEIRQHWVERRDEWRKLGVLADAAKLAETILEELEQLAVEDANELLTLSDAGREAGLHPDSIGRAVRQGRLTNHGRPNAPRVRRGDLCALAPRQRRGTGENGPIATSLPAITRDAIAGKLPRITRG